MIDAPTSVPEAKKTVGRHSDGRFTAGNPGRPKGSRNKANRETLDAISNLRGKAIQTLSDQLDQGNVKAAMFILQRFLPSERVVDVTATDTEALIENEITPSEANKIAMSLKQLTDIEHMAAIKDRLDELEAIISGAKH